jgi:methyl-accepting chemotaxis protein
MLGKLSIRAKLLVALLLLAATGGFVLWKAVGALQETRAELAGLERIVAELRARPDGAASAPIERALQAAQAGAAEAQADLVIAGAIVLATGLVLALLFLLIGVALPIGRVAEAARNLAKGDLWTDLPDDARRDDLGTLTAALKSLKRAVIEQRGRADVAEQKLAEALETHAQAQARDRQLAEEIRHIAESTRHDAEQRIRALETGLREAAERQATERRHETQSQVERRDRIAQMSLAFERSAFDARRAASGALDSLAGLADAVAKAGAVAAGAQSTASEATAGLEHSLQAAGSRADALARSIRGIVDRARGSAKSAAEALGRARSTDVEVQALAEAAQRIGDIVGVIQAIARQTHLLALNASIEASRAGIAGKGFQVVAGEVKALADQTARATDQVTRQIAAIQDRVERSVDAIRGIGDAVGQVAVIADGIAGSVEQEGAAMVELGHHLDQAAAHAQSAGRALQPLGEAATALTQSTCAMQEAATVIAKRLTALEGDIGRYLQAVRDL